MQTALDYIQLNKEEAYKEYASAWLKSLSEIGLVSASKNDAKAVIDMLFDLEARILRIMNKGKIIGYLGFFIKYEYGNYSCYLEFIYILTGFRRKGFASKAIDYMQKICKKKNVKHIRLWISVKNTKSIEFFRSLKYSPGSVEYGKTLDDHIINY